MNKIILYWKNEFQKNQLLFVIEIIGTILSISASLTLSIFTYNTPLLLIYILWLLGSGLLLLSSYIRQASWWICLMTFYTMINIIGLINIIG